MTAHLDSPAERAGRADGPPVAGGCHAAGFVPDRFVIPPPPALHDTLVLAPLGPEHTEGDYSAWTSSIDHIRNTPGFQGYPWPVEAMTLAENTADLRQHADDFQQRRGFTYTVLDGVEVIGCVYIYPSGRVGWAQVRSWVRADRAVLDRELYETVRRWLAADWPFDGVDYASR